MKQREERASDDSLVCGQIYIVGDSTDRVKKRVFTPRRSPRRNLRPPLEKSQQLYVLCSSFHQGTDVASVGRDLNLYEVVFSVCRDQVARELI